MPATVINATPTAEQMPNQGATGLYQEIEVPGDYEVVLRDVEDYDKGTDRKGWIFLYDCETPSGGTVEFKFWLSFSQSSRWKIFQAFDAHGQPIVEGENSEFDPNSLIGSMCGAHIDFDRDKDSGEATSSYRGIQRVFSLAEESDLEEGTPEPVSLDAEAPATI